MPTFGNLGHVLTNIGNSGSAGTIENYTCIAAPINGPYLYALDNTTSNRNIEYNVSLNTWDANPSTAGNHNPSLFLSAGSHGSSTYTPTNSDSNIHIGYVGNSGNHWMATFSVNYTATGGTGTTGSASTQKKVFCNFW